MPYGGSRVFTAGAFENEAEKQRKIISTEAKKLVLVRDSAWTDEMHI